MTATTTTKGLTTLVCNGTRGTRTVLENRAVEWREKRERTNHEIIKAHQEHLINVQRKNTFTSAWLTFVQSLSLRFASLFLRVVSAVAV